MKIKGKEIPAPKPVNVVLPRGDEDIVFTCKAVLDESEFKRLCPEPEVPVITRPGGVTEPDPSDKRYREAIDKYAKRKLAWTIITSMSATDGLTWEKVNVHQPDTWELYDEELRDSGFTQGEINRIVSGVFDANSLNEARFKEAFERFSRSQAKTAAG